MDAFEQLAAEIFRGQGYWVRSGFKVELTRDDKQQIGLPSCPRWELDLIAYRPAARELLVLECKSYLDSGGVHAAHFTPGARLAGRYKLFNSPSLRTTVLNRLRHQLAAAGLCLDDVELRLGLVYAQATEFNETLLKTRFAAEQWCLFGPDFLRLHLKRLASGPYENSTAAVVAKILLRQPSSDHRNGCDEAAIEPELSMPAAAPRPRLVCIPSHAQEA